MPHSLRGWIVGATSTLALVLPGGALLRAAEPVQGRFAEATPAQPTTYRIGLSVRPLEKEQREALKTENGLVVEAVLPESPAAKAGLQPGDVIVSAGGKPVGQREQIVQAVAAAKDGPLSLELLRGKETRTIEVRPEKVAGEGGEGVTITLGERESGVERAPAERRLQAELGRLAGTLYRPQAGQPGAPLAGAGSLSVPLPDDMEVTIQKRGGKASTVTVRQGEKMWRTTENELGMLPPQAQQYAGRLLGKPTPAWSGWGALSNAQPGQPQSPWVPQAQPAQPGLQVFPGGGVTWEVREGREPARVIAVPDGGKQAHALQEQIEQLQRQAEALRKAEAARTPAPADPNAK